MMLLKKFIPVICTAGINGGIEMSLQELLQTVKSEYEVVCNGQKINDMANLEMKKFVVKSISAVGGVIHVQVAEHTSIPNDLNEDWVKEHVEKYGVLPNAFDGC